MTLTPAELHSKLVAAAADHYADTYLKLMKYEAQGGRLPGVELPSKQQLVDMFTQTTPGYWQSLPPEEAQSQLEQWRSAEGGA
jgi:hypothetical protein